MRITNLLSYQNYPNTNKSDIGVVASSYLSKKNNSLESISFKSKVPIPKPDNSYKAPSLATLSKIAAICFAIIAIHKCYVQKARDSYDYKTTTTQIEQTIPQTEQSAPQTEQNSTQYIDQDN